MNEQNGSAFPPRTVAHNMGEFAHDVVALAELQMDLLKVDANECFRRLMPSLALLISSVAVALGSVPVALMALAWALIDSGLVAWQAYLLSALAGAALAGVAAFAGWRLLQNSSVLFNRSKDEFSSNVKWVKRVLKRHRAGVGDQVRPHRMSHSNT